MTSAVTFTTLSFGRPADPAGTKTVPGRAARRVLEVMTAAMAVFKRLPL